MNINGQNDGKSTMADPGKLMKFYENKNILITGATGYVGKVCLIKLLSSFKDIANIYIIMRAKNGQTIQQRFNKLLNAAPFTCKLEALTPEIEKDLLRGDSTRSKAINIQKCWLEAPSRLKALDWTKVKLLEGDMSLPELGISDESKKLIWEKVDVIFNIAASVSFDAPLKQNLRDNYLGTSNLIKLASNCQRLSSLVHVSTFFSNSHRPNIEEKVLPMERDCEKMAELIDSLPDSICKALENPEFMENRPNTYIYTKAMTEDLLKKHESKLPIAIVKPSIVTPAYRHPVPAWVDNVNGPMGLGALASIGILRTIDWNYDGVADFIPVDMVANSIIVVAERTARLYPKEIKVYNCSSSSLNPMSWGRCFEILRTEGLKSPPYKLLRIPIEVPRYKRANPVSFNAIKLSELLFAYLIDLILVICGQKTLLVRLTKKLHHGYELLKPFTTNEYTCDNDNLMAAFHDLDPSEKEEFDFDVGRLDMEEYFRSCYYGCRLGILKEGVANLQSAITKRTIHMYVGVVFKLMIYLMLAWNSYRLLSNSSVQISSTVGNLGNSLRPQISQLQSTFELVMNRS